MVWVAAVGLGAARVAAQRGPRRPVPPVLVDDVDVEVDEGDEPRDLPPGLRRAAEEGDRAFDGESEADGSAESDAPTLASPPQPRITAAEQREATLAYERLTVPSRGRRGAPAQRAFAERLHAFALRYPGAAETPVALGQEAQILTQPLSWRTEASVAEATLRRVDALAELPGAPVDELGRTLQQAISAAYGRRRLPEPLIERLIARYGNVMDSVALDLRAQRERDAQEAAIARDPEALRERARARAELNRCIDECLNFEDTCTAYRQRVLVSGGGRLYVQRQRVTTRCAARLEDCQMECGMDEHDPEYVGED